MEQKIAEIEVQMELLKSQIDELSRNRILSCWVGDVYQYFCWVLFKAYKDSKQINDAIFFNSNQIVEALSFRDEDVYEEEDEADKNIITRQRIAKKTATRIVEDVLMMNLDTVLEMEGTCNHSLGYKPLIVKTRYNDQAYMKKQLLEFQLIIKLWGDHNNDIQFATEIVSWTCQMFEYQFGTKINSLQFSYNCDTSCALYEHWTKNPNLESLLEPIANMYQYWSQEANTKQLPLLTKDTRLLIRTVFEEKKKLAEHDCDNNLDEISYLNMAIGEIDQCNELL